MTKKKKRLLILLPLLLIICALTIVIICDRFVFAVETDELFPKPDTMIGFYAGCQTELSDAQQETIYQALSQWESTERFFTVRSGNAVRLQDYRDAALYIELRYKRDHCFVGSVKTDGDPITDLTFNTISIFFFEEAIGIVPGDAGEQYSDSYGRLLLRCDQEYEELSCIARKEVGASIRSPMGGLWESTNIDAVATSDLWQEPDSMVISKNGEGRLLSDAEKVQLYTAFSQMRDGRHPVTGPYGSRDIYTAQEIYDQM